MIWVAVAAVAWASPPFSPDLPGAAGASLGASDPAPARAVVTGRVREVGSGLPLAARVTASGAEGGPTFGVDARVDGTYVLALPPGEWTLTAADRDHRPSSETVTLAAGREFAADWLLDRYTWATEIVVWGEEKREEASRTEISADELRHVPGAFGDPIRALQSLPGVARPSSLEGDIVVRGSEGINTATYIDEIPVPYLFHFFIGRSVINPSLLDDVEFYAGGMPSRFGDSTQAVVNARTLDTAPLPGLHGRATLDLLDGSIAGEGRLGSHVTFQAGYRVSWIGALIGTGVEVYALAKGFGGEYRPAYPSISYEDHLARLSWEDARDRVVATWLGARDAVIIHPERYDTDGDGDIEAEPLPDLPWNPNRIMDTAFHRWQLRWDRRNPGDIHATWVAFGPDREVSLLEGVGQFSNGLDFGRIAGWTVVAKRTDRFEFASGNVVQAGLDTWIDPVVAQDYQDWVPPAGVPTTSDFRSSTGAWGEVQHAFGTTWVAPGLRLPIDSFNHRLWTDVEPRLTVRRPVSERWTAVGFAGRFTQVPPIDRYAEGIGNPSLGLMRAVQVSAGFEGRWPTGLQVDATLYGSRTDGLIVKDLKVILDHYDADGVSSVAETTVVPAYSATVGYAFGAEGFVRLRPNHGFWGWTALSVGRALRLQPDGTLIPGDYDLPASLTLVAARELPAAFQASGRFRITSGYPVTPLWGSYDATTGTWQAVTGDPNSERFPVFRQLDLRVDRTWTGRRARWTLYLDVLNVLNTRNPFLADYNANYTVLEPTIWVPIIPNIGLEVAY